MHRFQPHTNRPLGQVTRGKTAPNRLRQVDHFLAAYDRALVARREGPFLDALYVDLGYGAEPTTTLESARRLRRINPELGVLGVEIDPERVRRGLPFADEKTYFRLGGFNLPLQETGPGQQERVRLVRALNVLRQYDEQQVAAAYDQVLAAMLPGGLFLDGTSDPYGRVWTGNLLRCGTGATAPRWHQEALVLGANLRVGFDVDAFQTRLPKSYIHHMVPGQKIFQFMEAWKAAVRETRSHGVWGPRDWFVAAGRLLNEQGYRIGRPDKWLRRGWLVWLEPDLNRG